MSTYPIALGALVIAGVASAASLAASQDAEKRDALVCELSLGQSGQIVTLRAEAQARHATTGTYTLEVEQSGPGGSTRIRQGGDFALQPGERVTLGEARLSGRARDLRAELTLTAKGRRQTCTDLGL